jgi:glycosyltransferase involved in cell wall biosynthesis
MKIAFIGQKGIPATSGGVERYVEELAIRLAKEGHDVICYCRSHYTPKNLKEYRGVKLVHLPTINTKYLDAIVHTFLATIDVLFRRVDIIHYNAIGPSSLLWIPRILGRGARVVSTFHSDDRRQAKWGWLAKKFLGFGAYSALHFAHRTITIARVQQENCRQEFGGDSVYIPYGVPQYDKVAPNLITENWGLRGNDYILSISRLVKHKGIHYLIEAYKAQKTDKKLVIVGEASFTSEYVQELKDLAEGNPNIIFTGEQTGQALAELFSNSYLFVQPSESEGLSIALLEAMSYGSAVLVSDIPENREAIADTGFTFRNKSVNDLERKLKFLLDNSQMVSEKGEEASRLVAVEHNWEQVVKKTVALYDQLLVDQAIKKFGKLVNYSR